MKRLLRWLGFHVHEWGPWVEYEATRRAIHAGILIGEEYTQTRQRRQCKTCGLTQRRDI